MISWGLVWAFSLCFYLFIYFFPFPATPPPAEADERYGAFSKKLCIRHHHQNKKILKKRFGRHESPARLCARNCFVFVRLVCVRPLRHCACAPLRRSSSAHRALGLVMQPPKSFSLARRGPICINQNAEQMDGTAVALRCPPPSPSPV